MFKNIFKRDPSSASPQRQGQGGSPPGGGMKNNTTDVNGTGSSPRRTTNAKKNTLEQPDDAEGFLCPMCMKSFSNPDILQHHFDSVHASENSQQVSAEKEVEMLKMQLTASEESRGLLSSELVSMQKQMQELAAQNQTSDDVVTMNGEQLQKYEEKCELMEVERDMLAQRCQDAEKRLDDMRETLYKTEKNCQSANDAVKSEKEKTSLIAAQLSQEQNRSRQLETEARTLSTQLKQTQISMEKIKASSGRADELTAKLAGKEELCRSLDLQIQELKQVALKHENEVDQLRKALQTKDENLSRVQGTHNEAKSMLESKIQSMEALIQEKTSAFDRAQGELDQLVHKNATLETRLSAQQDELAEANKKYDGLHNNFVQKIEAGEGTSMLMTELKEENARTQEKLKHMEEKLANEKEESFQKLSTAEGLKREVERTLSATIDELESLRQEAKGREEAMSSEIKELTEKVENLLEEKDVQQLQMSQVAEETRATLVELNSKLEKKQIEVKQLEDLCLQKQSNCDILEVQLEEKTVITTRLQEEVEGITGQLTEKVNQLDSVKEQTMHESTELKSELITAQVSIQEWKSKCESVTNDLDSLRNLYEAKAEELEQTETNSQRRIFDLESSEDLLKEKLSALDQLQTDYSAMNDQCSDLSIKVDSLQQKLHSVERDNTTLNAQIAEMLSCQDLTQQQLQETANQLQEAQSRLESTSSEKDTISQQLLEKDACLIALQHRLDEQITSSESLQKSLLDQIDTLESGAKTKQADQQTLVDRLNAELSEAKSNLKKQSEINEALTKEHHDLITNFDVQTNEMTKLRNQLETVTNQLEETQVAMQRKVDDQAHVLQETSEILQRTADENEALSHANAELRLEKESVEEHLLSAQATSDDWQCKHRLLQDDMNALREALSQEKSNAEEAKQLLITQKLQLQNTNESLQASLTALELELKEATAAKEDAEEKAQEQLTSLQRALEVEKSKFEETEADFNMQVVSLNESLHLNKADLTATQEKLMDVVKHNDELRKLHLELETKLETSHDDRRILLDRCLASENETMKLREEKEMIKQQLDQTSAALHELGRENQSLQIKTTKVQSRKWASDAEVTDCANCAKAFSVTIRKHHCRNCGNIFCNDCSSKQAALPASKKPVRVCDACYVELNK